MRKFKVGDKVKLNKRTPKVLLLELGMRYWRARTIVDVDVDPRWHFAVYLIGHNNRAWGPARIWVRSYMLDYADRRESPQTPPVGNLASGGSSILVRGRNSQDIRLRGSQGGFGEYNRKEA